MRQSENLAPNASLDRTQLINLLHVKIQSIDWESAKADMRSFIADPERLNIWSSKFFFSLIDHLEVC